VAVNPVGTAGADADALDAGVTPALVAEFALEFSGFVDCTT